MDKNVIKTELLNLIDEVGTEGERLGVLSSHIDHVLEDLADTQPNPAQVGMIERLETVNSYIKHELDVLEDTLKRVESARKDSHGNH